ncbi:unnamed protein product [Closterium sp. Naga37s-1]|nr:unnamed protein product [Closterium sp. Naga37s-1]
MAVDVASMSVEELEAVWLRRAGMRSDLSVTIPGVTAPGVTVSGVSFNVHKYPLYARTSPASVMEWISRSHHLMFLLPPLSRLTSHAMPSLHRPYAPPKMTPRKGMGKYRVNLLSLRPSLTPLLPSLHPPSLPKSPHPPAAFLGMTDDSRKGMGKYRVNLLSCHPSLTSMPPSLSSPSSCFPLPSSSPAAFLGMTDDSRKGMGKYRVNLLSFAAAAMAGMLKHADAALAVLRGCAGLLAEADALGIVDEAADRLADHAVTSHNLCTTPIHTCDGIALLPLDIFLRVLGKFKEKNLPEKEIGSAIAFYAQHNLPDPKSLAALSYSDLPPPSPHSSSSSSTSSSSSASLSPAHYRRVLEGLTAALPAAAASVPMQPLLGLLRCAIVLNASEGVKATLQRRAGALFTDASLDDLLMLETSDVQGLLHGFASEEHLSTLPDRAQALQAAAALIDSYLLHLSSPPTPYPDAAASASHSSPAPFFSPPYRQQQHSSTLYLLHLSSPPTPYPDAAADGTSATVARAAT